MEPSVPHLPIHARELTAIEELVNAITHGIAAVAAFVAFIFLMIMSRRGRVPGSTLPLGVYAISLFTLYFSSTCYHSVRSRRWKRVFRSIDHAAIYLLIAGTYTPIMILLVGGIWSTAIIATLWVVATIGVLFKAFFVGKHQSLSIILYCIMGWAGVAAIHPILTRLPTGCVLWILAGGILYTSGIAFYRWKQLPFHHAIWHLFVVAGSAAHFVAIEQYIL